MSTKTIALESSVYEKLATVKRQSESFTKVIARLLKNAEEMNTGGTIADSLASFTPLGASDAGQMLSVVKENRDRETWATNDLR